jgi:hypothetical protein
VSSKALASALFGYGADIKVKNIVMEIFFSILPPVYMSNYQIISPTDELIVDLFFQYVKQTLVDRGELGDISQALVSETFPDIRFDELTETEIRLLSDVAIKRTVFRAIEKLSARLYNPQSKVAELNNFDKDITKRNFIDETVDQFFMMEKTSKLSFLDKNGQIKEWLGWAANEKQRKFYRTTKPEAGIPTTTSFGIPVVSEYKDPKFCFEPYVRVTAKGTTDIQKCISELDISAAQLKALSDEIVKMFFVLGDGDANPLLKPTLEANLPTISLNTFVCSVDDFKNYLNAVLFPNVNANIKDISIVQFRETLDAFLKSVSLGVRCSVDVVRSAPIDSSSTVLDEAFPEKTFFYEEPYALEESNIFSTEGKIVGKTYTHVTYVLSATENPYKASEYTKVVAEGAKFNDIDLNKVFKLSAYPTDASVAELLVIDLMKTKDFDAVIKSVFVPAFLFNTINVIPNVEIAKEIIPIMRKNGVFKGIDDGINELFSSLSAYLSGDFPWLRDCGELARLL